MKTGIICILAVIALASGQDGTAGEATSQANDEIETEVCAPGSTKKLDCNSCFCVEDGSGWACTEIGCYHPAFINVEGTVTETKEDNPVERVRRDEIQVQSNDGPQSEVCVQGTTKKIDCNNCFCVGNGLGWACTKKGCYSPVFINPDNTTTQPDQTGAAH